LKAFTWSLANEVFLAGWIETLTGLALSAAERDDVAFAVRAVLSRPVPERSIGALRSFLNGSSHAGGSARVVTALARWQADGPLGWAFDNPHDEIGLDARFLGYDMTDFLDTPELRTPMMAYLFHRVESLITGERIVIVVDEFWKALADEGFRDLARDKLKTIRKQNGLVVFATQSPRDALASPIAHTIIEQCPTQIFMPNPRASADDYIGGMKLSAREFQLVARDMSAANRRFLIRQGQASVVVELDLRGMDRELAVLSGRTQWGGLLDSVRREVGDDPAVWLPVFHQRRQAA
jgi:type IV secretion system protein VirB4